MPDRGRERAALAEEIAADLAGGTPMSFITAHFSRGRNVS